ncbi:MAG: toprim domain-containing protein [Patescibacteria group bacterium]
MKVENYLNEKGINYKEKNGELITKCIFCGKEDHMYICAETGMFDCKRCGEKGNLTTLKNHLGDNNFNSSRSKRKKKMVPVLVEECFHNLPEKIRSYLNQRGVDDDLIEDYKIGWGEFYGRNWITIPIKNENGDYEFFKLRKDPEGTTNDLKYCFYPTGSQTSLLGWNYLQSDSNEIVICEGEFDQMILGKYGIPAITSTAGVGTFKKEWLSYLKNFRKIFICFDKDEAGQEGMKKLSEKIESHTSKASIYTIKLPERLPDKGDITDYFEKYHGNPDELMIELPEFAGGKKPVDVSKFQPMGMDDLNKILGLTIKKDESNKTLAFLCMLSAFTEGSQFNISFNAPSSSGKSFIPLEVSQLFPSEDVIKLSDCSPSAFYHEQGKFDKEKNEIVINLSRKIIIFLDQPNNQLLQKLRSLLSHDDKKIYAKIADKSQKGGNRTKTVAIIGYPSVIFCSAGLRVDEQEASRFLLLSPESNQEKIREGILSKIEKEADPEGYKNWLENDPDRKLLKERVEAVRNEEIKEVRLHDKEAIEKAFLKNKKSYKPRHQRDINRLISIVKSIALLNLWFREKDENGFLITAQEDIESALKLWEKVEESQELNLPPYIYEIYKSVILPAYQEATKEGLRVGLTRREMMDKHFKVYSRFIPDWQLRQQIIPMLESSGLISQEPDPQDKRKFLIVPADK